MHDQTLSLCLLGAFAACASCLATALTLGPARRLSKALGAIDRPGGRKHHEGEIPRLGGITIIVGLLAGLLTAFLVAGGSSAAQLNLAAELPLLAAAGLIFLVGAVDDIGDISCSKKLIGQIAAATIVVSAGWRIDHLDLPVVGSLDLGSFSSLFTVFWIVLVINSINMIDGANGLAASCITIISFSMLLLEVMQLHTFSSFILASMAGSCLGFLVHNWSGRIFMGDSGSMTLGLLLVATGLHSGAAEIIPGTPGNPVSAQALFLAVPTLDAILVVVWRFISSRDRKLLRRCRGVFSGDRNHLHHLIQHLVPGPRSVVASVCLLVLLSSGAALWVARTGSSELGIVLIIVSAVALLAVRHAGIARRDQDEWQQHRGPAPTISAAQPHLTDTR